jgi:AcrR family transcriptional regulator
MARSRPSRKADGPRRPRGRPASIDRERIVAAAVELGVPNLTMKGVARALGVSDAALYHHFASRDALVAAVVDEAVRGAAFPEDRGQRWREWLTEFAEALRELFLANPGSAEFGALRGPTSPEQVELVARAVGVLVRSGFDANEAAMIYSLLSSYVVTTVGAEERRAKARKEGQDIPARFAEALRTLGEDDSRLLRQVAEKWSRATPRERFRYGLEVILDGVAARASKRS